MSKWKEYFQRLLSTPVVVHNHLYYLFLFVAIFSMHATHFWLFHQKLNFSYLFFIFSAFFQTFLEVCILISLGKLIQKTTSSFLFGSYVLITFFLLVVHAADMLLLRLWDVTFWGMVLSLMNESVESLLELLIASNVPPLMWGLLVLSVPAILLTAGLFVFRFTEKKSSQKPFQILFKEVGVLFCVVPSFLVVCNLSMGPQIPFTDYHRIEKGLPWKVGLASKNERSIEGVFSLPNNTHSTTQVQALEKRPDIFLFVVESLREDFINSETAPHLTSFKESALSFEKALSSGNGTQCSWYSLFFSEPALYWEGISHKTQGAPTLTLMKQLGYKIHVLSSSRLGYYNMDTTLFGKNHALTDSFTYFGVDKASSRYEADAAVITELCHQVSQGEGGRLFLVFLDSTHFGYSLPKDKNLPFTPYPNEIGYLGALYSKTALEGIKNRYRNAIYSIDELFGRFVHALKTSPSWEESVVVFTSDHGEEFYEHGHLFHASNLDRQQTRVPLVMKLGNKEPSSCDSKKIASHEDVFPTLLHHLQGSTALEKFRSGLSLISDKKRKYASVARFNFNKSPTDFLIQSEEFKMVLSLSSKKCKVLSVTDTEDCPLNWSLDKIEQELRDAYQNLFSGDGRP